MGRGEELSDFQRGTVVGCHLCKKSIRQISALLNLPASTVGGVISKWKRGITTVLPRSGRPQKLKEEHRKVLERVALEMSVPSVEALTTEFQSASGAKVSTSTVRRELREMGYTGKVSTYNKVPKKEKRAKKTKVAPSPDTAMVDVSRLNLRVGRIISSQPLPEDEGVYLQQVDVGESSPRTVVSELATHVPSDEMQNRLAVLLCNMKPAQVRGVKSQALVMCARSPDQLQILDPPSGAIPGDRVTFQGFPGEADKELDPKHKVWEQIQTDLWTDGECVATYRGVAFQVAGKGVCTAQTMSNTQIK